MNSVHIYWIEYQHLDISKKGMSAKSIQVLQKCGICHAQIDIQ